MAAKSSQLQIRVSPAEKAAIQRAARQAGLEVSSFVLMRALPPPSRRFQELAQACAGGAGAERFALAELSEWIARLAAAELREAVATPPPAGLTPYLENYIAAMVESACARRGLRPPPWAARIPPLPLPVFGSGLASLRLYLLTHSPAPFRRRNIFIDAAVGTRV